MLARSTVHRLGLVLAIAGAYGFCGTPGDLAFVRSALAGPAPTGTAEFDITYFATEYDEAGNPRRGRRLTVNDLSFFVNKARCECGQQITAEIKARITGSVAQATRVRVYVGARCDEGETGINPQARPCAQLTEQPLGFFTAGSAPTYRFGPLWIASGVVPGPNQLLDEENVDAIEPAGNCQSQEGYGGIWICVETNGQPECQADEWVVQGNQSVNLGETGMAQGISYDYDGPFLQITDAKVQSGDGALLVSWDQASSGTAYGFRVLCVDENGEPVPGKDGYSRSPSDLTDEHDGTIYYTKQNLCGDDPFSPVIEGEGSNQGDPGPSGDTGGIDTGGDETGGFDTGGEDTGAGVSPIFEGGTVRHSMHCCAPIADGTCGGSTEDNVCAAMVNAKRPACERLWDEACAALAAEYCFECGGSGYCCAAHGGRGCSDDACEQAVCTVDFLDCCSGAWTSDCAARAETLPACTEQVCAVEDDGGTTSDGGTTGSDSSTTGGTMTTGGSDTGTGTDTDTDTETGGDNSPAALALDTLDWRYVCSGHVSGNAESVRISGLENEREYKLIVVAYDRNGNPTKASEVLTGRPRETTDFWEQCAEQGELCGTGGFCSCSVEGEDDGRSTLLLLGMLGLGGWVRRRRRAA